MLKHGLLDRTERILQDEGYVTCRYRGCFDIAAKKHRLLFLKVLQNIDSFSEEQARNLSILAKNMAATMFLIGENTTRENLQEGIVYERFGIAAVCFETFRLFLKEGIFPRIYRKRGGLFVSINRDTLREMRKSRGLTQMELAEMVGISKKAIYEHEARNLKMLLSIAQRIEDVLEKKIIKNIDISKIGVGGQGKPGDMLEKKVGGDLEKLGFSIDFVKQAPVDIVAKKEALLVSDVEADKKRLKKRTEELKGFIGVAQKPAVVITEDIKDRDSEIPIVQRKELGEMSSRRLFKIAKKSRKYK
ncbi:MAG: helix-turn-helix domain-containing protein [Candidatus Aenigmatarchaeota archaeon]